MTDSLDRRALLSLGVLAAAGSALPKHANAQETEAQHMRRMMEIPPDAPVISMLVYPKMVALDLIGPMTVLNILRCRIELVWRDRTPVATDVGIPFAATRTFADAAPAPDVLFVPGGIMGTIACMNDPEVCGFLADRGARAKWVTSVCTGGLLLGAAGLLKGYDATAHWAVADLLPLMGARRVNGRVVRDRNRMTGGGVTAGIDFGLALAAELRGEEAARRVQLMIEYAPEPPFANGTPVEAGPARVAAARAGRRWMDEQARLAAVAAGRRLGLT
jgi:putative intracellular protease/amidase